MAVTLGADGRDNIEQIINGDCTLISSAVDCRDQLLVRLESINDAKSVTNTEEKFRRLEQQLNVWMHQQMIANQGNVIQTTKISEPKHNTESSKVLNTHF